MCGRVAGHLLRGIFVREERTRSPTVVEHGARCGECGGSLLVEPEEPLTPAVAEDVIGPESPVAPDGAAPEPVRRCYPSGASTDATRR